MSRPSVVLVAMPWHALGLPSIQLGILARVLELAGIATEVRSLMATPDSYALTDARCRSF